MTAAKKISRAQVRTEARRAAIIDAALVEFVGQGFEKARLDRVAAAAGCAKGTLYLYFPSKEALFVGVVKAQVAPVITSLTQQIENSPLPTADLLRMALTAVLTMAMETRVGQLLLLLVREGWQFPELAAYYRQEVIAQGLGVMSAIFDRGVARGELRQKPDFAPFLMAMPMVFLTVWRSTFEQDGQREIDPIAFIQSYLETMLRGIAAAGDA